MLFTKLSSTLKENINKNNFWRFVSDERLPENGRSFKLMALEGSYKREKSFEHTLLSSTDTGYFRRETSHSHDNLCEVDPSIQYIRTPVPIRKQFSCRLYNNTETSPRLR